MDEAILEVMNDGCDHYQRLAAADPEGIVRFTLHHLDDVER